MTVEIFRSVKRVMRLGDVGSQGSDRPLIRFAQSVDAAPEEDD